MKKFAGMSPIFSAHFLVHTLMPFTGVVKPHSTMILPERHSPARYLGGFLSNRKNMFSIPSLVAKTDMLTSIQKEAFLVLLINYEYCCGCDILGTFGNLTESLNKEMRIEYLAQVYFWAQTKPRLFWLRITKKYPEF